MPGNPQKVTYEAPIASMSTTAEIQGLTITAPSTHDLRVVSWLSAILNETQPSQPAITHRMRRASTAGTGTTITASKVNPQAGTAIASSAKKTITVDATLVSGDGPQDAAAISFNAQLYKTYPLNPNDPNSMQPVILHGETGVFTIQRNGAATSTPNGIIIVTVEEIPI